MGRKRKRTRATAASEPPAAPAAEQKKTLFDDEEEEATGGDPSVLRVNSKFAKSYTRTKTIQEVKRLDRLHGEEYSDSYSGEEDSEGVLAGDVAKEFLEILPLLSTQDPSLKEDDRAFFKETELSISSADEGEEENGGASGKVLGYKEQRRLEIEALMAGKAPDEDEDTPSRSASRGKGLSIAEKERLAKAEFLNAAGGVGDDELLSLREADEEGSAANEYKSYMESRQKGKGGDQGKGGGGEGGGDDLLTKFWMNEADMNDEDKFLRRYILNKGWVPDDKNKMPAYKDLVAVSEEDSEDLELDTMGDEFEKAYNFRYEEPGGTELVTHVRQSVESARRPKETRKKQRQRKKERQEREKKQREDEKRRLKKLKKAQIMDKLEQLQLSAGLPGKKMKALKLDAEFDPEAWDQQMAEIFDDQYYDDEGDIKGKPVVLGDDEADWETTLENLIQEKKNSNSAETDETEEKGVRDVEKSLQEYYNLDYEDMIGGQEVRFKYTKVLPLDYGLNSIDVLLNEDRDLNKLVSLKKLAPYREDEGRRGGDSSGQKHRQRRKRKRSELGDSESSKNRHHKKRKQG